MKILTKQELPLLLEQALTKWYGNPPTNVDPGEALESIILAQHFCNFTQWNLEDEVRRQDVPDSFLVQLKRDIDASNQRRNNLMERIDEWVLRYMNAVDCSSADLNSETAGMMVDRISILTLKIYHMRINSKRVADKELAAECERKVEILFLQRDDLLGCLEKLMKDFAAGVRYFKIYRQYKAYNDPRLNPALASTVTKRRNSFGSLENL